MLNKLNKFQVFFWDFDGVLMNSNATRDLGFETVLNSYPKNQVKDLIEFHRKNGGLSRYVKFKYFFEEIRKEKINENVFNELLNNFSVIMLKNLINEKLLISETLDYVFNNYTTKKMFIISGSDQNELRFICNKLKIDKYFISIYGSPESKNRLIKNQINLHKFYENNCVMIGDSINDYEAAIENNISFFGYNNPDVELLTNI